MSAFAVNTLILGFFYLIFCAQVYGLYGYFHRDWRASADKEIIDLAAPFLIAICLMLGATLWIAFAGLSGLVWAYIGTRIRKLATDPKRLPKTVSLGIAPYYIGSVGRTLFFDILTIGTTAIAAFVMLPQL